MVTNECDSPETMPVPGPEFWVFGYGSLIWDPGFEFMQSRPCRIFGYHRALCIWSLKYRGTEKCPGLVLGLARGGSCRGIAYKVSKSNSLATAEYLFDREMVSRAYQPKLVNLHFDCGQSKPALTFVAIPGHPQFAGLLDQGSIVKIVRKARGPRGPNTEYVINTVSHLNDMGIEDTILQQVASAL